MAIEVINRGTSANDGTGDNIREAFRKVNDNFDQVLTNDTTDYTTATTPLAGTEIALVEQGGTFKKVAVSEFGGGGTQSYFVDWEGYIQFTQNPTGWYSRGLGPQNVYWTSQFTTSIGTNPQSFDARTNCKVLPFDCQLTNANIRINQVNNMRTINIKAYKFNFVSGSVTPTNVVEVMNLSVAVSGATMPLTLVQGVDFTINSANLSKGDNFLFVVNQSTDLSGVACNISMNFQFDKI